MYLWGKNYNKIMEIFLFGLFPINIILLGVGLQKKPALTSVFTSTAPTPFHFLPPGK